MNSEPITAIRSLIGFFMLIMFLIVIVGALLFAFWIWMIIDCAKRKFKKDIDKVVWILVIIFLNLIGAVVYYFAVKNSNKNSVDIGHKKKPRKK